MKSLLSFAAVVACCPASAISCGHAGDGGQSSSGLGLHLCVNTDRFSDPLTLQQLVRNELGKAVPRGTNNLIYVRDEARLSVVSSGAVWSVLARQSATLIADEGAVNLISDVSTPGSPSESYRHDVHLRFKGFAGYGLSIESGQFKLGKAGSMRLGVQGLSVKRLINRDLNGFASYDALRRSYGLYAESEYANDRLHYPYQAPFGGAGFGLLLNAQLRWQFTPATDAELTVEDLGLLRWARLPQETLTISSETSRLDGDGYLVYRPLAQGRNHQDGLTTTVSSTWTLAVRHTLNSQFAVDARLRRMTGFSDWLPYAGIQYKFGDGWLLRSGWQFHERSLNLSAAVGAWSLRIAGDRMDGHAHARSAMLSWQASLK